jgi:hypothetical protein
MVDLPTLAPRRWIGVGILDLYLAHQCVALGDTHNITYVPQMLVHIDIGPPTEGEIAQFAILNDPEHASERIYMFVRWEAGHYFLVLFDYTRRRSIRFGRQYTVQRPMYTDNENWNLWRGPALWARVGALAGIEEYEAVPIVSGYDWKQVCLNTKWCFCYLTKSDRTGMTVEPGLQPSPINSSLKVSGAHPPFHPCHAHT